MCQVYLALMPELRIDFATCRSEASAFLRLRFPAAWSNSFVSEVGLFLEAMYAANSSSLLL